MNLNPRLTVRPGRSPRPRRPAWSWSEYGAPVVPAGQMAGCSTSQHPLLAKLPADAPEHEAEGIATATTTREEEKALQSHRRAKVADLSEGDEAVRTL